MKNDRKFSEDDYTCDGAYTCCGILNRCSFVSFQNLTFDAYFKSTVNESFGCSYNLRKCKIIYFLEDDTIKVVEPVVINSGLPQGIFIHDVCR